MESVDAKTKLEKAEQLLDEYEAQLGLPSYQTFPLSTEVSKLLALSQEDRIKLTADDCAEACIILAQFAAHIMRSYNREQTKSMWCNNEVLKTIGKHMPTYNAYSFDERKQLALSESEHAQKLESQRVMAESKAGRLAYMSKHVEFVAKSYETLSNVRRRDRQNG